MCPYVIYFNVYTEWLPLPGGQFVLKGRSNSVVYLIANMKVKYVHVLLKIVENEDLISKLLLFLVNY